VARGAGPPGPPDGTSSSAPNAQESREAEARAVQKKVQTWRLESLAERLVAIGVDDYFKTYRHVLEAGMGTPPPGGGPKHGDLTAGQRWVNGWLDALAEADSRKEPAPKGERMPDTNVQDVTGRMDELVASHLGPMATQPSMVGNRLLRRAIYTSMPVAVLRIVQRADGSIASTELVASSGEKKFDAYVLEHAALALAALPAPPTRTGAGLHPEGTRSDWAFFRNGATCGVALLRVY
jgi:hypothetical protein